MEAPEKLYVDTEDRLSDSILYGFTQKRKDDDIEYVRKDAFIGKVEMYIRSVADGLDRDDDVKAFINELRNYIKKD